MTSAPSISSMLAALCQQWPRIPAREIGKIEELEIAVFVDQRELTEAEERKVEEMWERYCGKTL